MSNLQNLLHHPTIVLLGWSLVHFLWQGVVVALILAGVLKAAKHFTAHSRYMIACTALLVLLACPVVTFVLMSPLSSAGQANLSFQSQNPQPMSASGGNADTAFLTSGSFLSSIAALPQQIPASRLLPFLVCVWVVGVGFLALRLVAGWLRIVKVRRSAVLLNNQVIISRLIELSRRMGIKTPVTLLEAALAPGPAVIGVLRPAILFPIAALTGLWPIQVEAILAHELAHIRRHDYLVNLLQSMVEILLFYHPAVWWVSGKIREERENCCDDLAVEACGDRTFYANCLADLDELRPAPLALAMGAMGTGGGLLPRIRRILGLPGGENCAASAAAGALVVIAVGTMLLFVTVGPPSGPAHHLELTRVVSLSNVLPSPTANNFDPSRGSEVEQTKASSGAVVQRGPDSDATLKESPRTPEARSDAAQPSAFGVAESSTPDNPSAFLQPHQSPRPPQGLAARSQFPLFPNLNAGTLWGGGWLPKLPPSRADSLQSPARASPRTGPANRTAVTDFPAVPSQFEKMIQQRRSEPAAPLSPMPVAPQSTPGAVRLPEGSSIHPRITNYGGLLFVPETNYVVPQDQNYVTPQSGNYVVPQYGNYIISQRNYNVPGRQGSSMAGSGGQSSSSGGSSNYVRPPQH